MKLSIQSLKVFAGAVTGNGNIGYYKRMVDLEELFHTIGISTENPDNDSRFYYTLKKLKECNGTHLLDDVLRITLDSRDYVGREDRRVETINELNKHFVHDGYRIVLRNSKCHVQSLGSSTIVVKNVEKLSDDFVNEQFQKCEDKLVATDYDGAITNARSLIEGVLGHIHKEVTGSRLQGTGDLKKDYKKVRDLLRMSPDKYTEESIRQVLNGFSSIVQGIDSLSNAMGDRHRRRFKPARRHAHLVINSAKTIVEFLIDSFKSQRDQE